MIPPIGSSNKRFRRELKDNEADFGLLGIYVEWAATIGRIYDQKMGVRFLLPAPLFKEIWMDFSAMIRRRAEGCIWTRFLDTGVEYGEHSRESLIKAEEKRIMDALLDSVCPPIQPPIPVSPQEEIKPCCLLEGGRDGIRGRIGALIKKTREDRGWSRSYLAERVPAIRGDEGLIAQIEDTLASIDDDDLFPLMAALNISLAKVMPISHELSGKIRDVWKSGMCEYGLGVCPATGDDLAPECLLDLYFMDAVLRELSE